jgi:nicotinate phosphoribosyltransferase
MAGDVLTVEGDAQDGVALIEPVMRDGRRLAASPSLAEVRDHAANNLAALPDRLRRLHGREGYPVKVSEALQALARDVDRRMR